MQKFIFILAILVGTLGCKSVKASPDTYNIADTMRAVVRLEAKNAYGSGTVFSESKTSYKILTNAHVVGKSGTVQVDFFEDGVHRLRVDGFVVWSRLDQFRRIDLAIVSVSKDKLKGYKPLVIKLASKDLALKQGQTVMSMGFPHARWPMAWIGSIKDQTLHILNFGPTPFQGQSGSALIVFVKENGKEEARIAAVIGWKTWEDRVGADGKLRGHGSAMHISILHKLIGYSDEPKTASTRPERQTKQVGNLHWGNSQGFNISQTVRLSVPYK